MTYVASQYGIDESVSLFCKTIGKGKKNYKHSYICTFYLKRIELKSLPQTKMLSNLLNQTKCIVMHWFHKKKKKKQTCMTI